VLRKARAKNEQQTNITTLGLAGTSQAHAAPPLSPPPPNIAISAAYPFSGSSASSAAPPDAENAENNPGVGHGGKASKKLTSFAGAGGAHMISPPAPAKRRKTAEPSGRPGAVHGKSTITG
jgi:hypothetical protein